MVPDPVPALLLLSFRLGDVCWRSDCNMTGKVDIKSNYTFDKCLVSRSAGRSHNHLSTAARDCQANSGQTREPEPSQDSASQQRALEGRRSQQGTASTALGDCSNRENLRE